MRKLLTYIQNNYVDIILSSFKALKKLEFQTTICIILFQLIEVVVEQLILKYIKSKIATLSSHRPSSFFSLYIHINLKQKNTYNQ